VHDTYIHIYTYIYRSNVLSKKRSRVLFAVKPLTVIIRRPGRKAISNESLLAGKRYDMECETTGSRPPAVITWYKGRRRQLKHTTVR
jgi:hypothetical protein